VRPEVRRSLDSLRDRVAKLEWTRQGLSDRRQQEAQGRAEVERRKDTVQGAIALANRCLAASIEAKEQIEALVSSGLQDIYGEGYSFSFEETSSKDGTVTGLRPTVRSGDKVHTDLPDDLGDGVVAIISFMCLLSAVMVYPGLPKVLIADEPLGEVDSDAWQRFGHWLQGVCEQTGLQVVMTTQMASKFGKVYRVSQTNGKARAVLQDDDAYEL
jgi:ABC-type dipeptide/oligopeptide/nickel transport system ATPase subunit